MTGVVYDAGDSSSLKAALTSNLATAAGVLEQMRSASDRLVAGLGTGELSGKGYAAVQALFAQVVAPCVTAARAELDTIRGELEKYSAQDGKISRFGVLKEDELNKQLVATIKQRDATEHLIEVNTRAANATTAVPGLVEAMEVRNRQLEVALIHLENEIKDLEDKLKALRGFADGTRGLFMGRLEALSAATGDVVALLKQLSEPAVLPGMKLNLLDATAEGLGAAATRRAILDNLAGKKVTVDAEGRLKSGDRFLYRPQGGHTKEYLYGRGKDFNKATGTRADHYKKWVKAGLKGAGDSVVDDFTGWKGASKLAKSGKVAGIAGTAVTVGANADKYFSDGVQGNDVQDFAVDTGVDIASGLVAAGAGAAVGSFFLPPLGTLVGAGVGILVNMAVNYEWAGGPSATDAAKTALKKTYR